MSKVRCSMKNPKSVWGGDMIPSTVADLPKFICEQSKHKIITYMKCKNGISFLSIRKQPPSLFPFIQTLQY